MDKTSLVTALKSKAPPPPTEGMGGGDGLKTKLMDKVEAICSSSGKAQAAAIEELKSELDEMAESPEEEKTETPEVEAGEDAVETPAKGKKMPWHEGYGS